MKNKITIITMGILFFLVSFLVTGCSTSHDVKLAPVEIKPIHITIDVNVKVDRALDDFFGDLDKTESEIKE
jgi:hypothetical protein